MTWQSIDFQGIATFDRTLSEQLNHYLADKNAYFGRAIASSFPEIIEASNPRLPGRTSETTLTEGVDAFEKRIKATMQQPDSEKISSAKLSDRINQVLWDYTELLQGIAVELFQQLEQVSVEQWRPELVKVVDTIKEMLIDRMDDLKWAIKRLETLLRDYRASLSDGKWNARIARILPWKSMIDHTMIKNLEKSQKFLKFRFQNFLNKYDHYMELEKQVDKKMSKFSSYHVLNQLEYEDQESFKNLYRILNLWKVNRHSKSLSDQELVRVLRYTINPEKALTLFKHYYQALEKQLFLHSRELKHLAQGAKNGFFDSNDAIKQLEFQSMLSNQRFELHTLGATISAYHSFLLESDPNPYVRAKGGFSEWTIGQEPLQTQALTDQEFNVEKLDRLYQRFADSFRSGPETLQAEESILRDAHTILHDMGQPLASHVMMSHLAHEFVDKLDELNELGSHNLENVDQMTILFSRALRTDWKYTTLYDVSKFHELYHIHMHILPMILDRPHVTRLKQFKLLLENLKKWVQEKSVPSHLQEVELTINDIKGYLQDFLAQVQRISRDSASLSHEIIAEIAQQLLEYRYLFGQFFHLLRQTEMEERLLRNRFLFVDHYFESIENKLVEMREGLKGQ